MIKLRLHLVVVAVLFIVYLKAMVTAKTVMFQSQGDPMEGFGSSFIFHDTGGFYCDGVKCPAKTKKCVVKKDSVPGKAEILVQKICKNRKGRVIYEEAETLSQPDGPEDFHSISETSIGGSGANINFQGGSFRKTDEIALTNELLRQSKFLEEQTKHIGSSITDTISKALEGMLRRTNFPFN